MDEILLTDADDGRRLDVRVGEVVRLRLSELAGAGYRWSVGTVDVTPVDMSSGHSTSHSAGHSARKAAEMVDVRNEGYERTHGATGSAGLSVWTLTAKAPGVVRVQLLHARPWEAPDKASRTFSVALDVVP